MLWLALAFSAGSAAVQLLPALPAPAWLLLPALAAAAIARSLPFAAACLCGLAWTALHAHQRLAGDWPCSRDREAVELEGQVIQPATQRAGRVDFELRTAVAAGGADLPERVRLSWYGATRIPEPGQRWRATARLRCRHGFANPGAPARELELLRQEIGANGHVSGKSPPEILADDEGERSVQRLRARIAATIEAAATQSASASVLQGLAVGVRGRIPDALWEAFAVTGIAHLLAISGLHVTAFALSLLFLVRGAWRLFRLVSPPSRIAVEMALVVLVSAAYVVLAGASLPALRTLAMVAIAALLRVLRRLLPVHESLAFAAFVLVAADPLALSSAGFWLSFVATAALLTVVEAGPGVGARLRSFARSQAAVTALLTPVLAAVFGRLSLVSPLVNAIAIPFFCLLLLPAVLIATLATMVAPEFAAGAWGWLADGLDPLWPVLEAIARLPAASWSPAAQPIAIYLAVGLVTLAAMLVPCRGLRTGAIVALFAIAFGRAGQESPGAWRLDVLDVGQGLSAVVQTAGHVLVFDTGPRWRGGGSAARVTLLPHLRARGIRRIDLLVLSHADADHTGGAGELRKHLPVARIVAGPGTTGVPVTAYCRRGQRWRWDGVEFETLHPGPGETGSDNDRSCALAIRGAGGSALLLADPEAPAERELVSLRAAADVVLLPHHGSRSSSSAELVNASAARLGIASAGFGNRWDMPHREVVARWRAAGTTVLTTADAGAISVRFGVGTGAIEVRTARGDSRRWWMP